MEIDKLVKARDENEEMITMLESENKEITIRICKIKGSCPHCRNWHYPHCGIQAGAN